MWFDELRGGVGVDELWVRIDVPGNGIFRVFSWKSDDSWFCSLGWKSRNWERESPMSAKDREETSTSTLGWVGCCFGIFWGTG